MRFDLTGKSVVLGVTGGIAAYKACEVVSRLRKMGADVYVIMTKNATEFVTPLTFETLSNHPVVTDTFARPETWEVVSCGRGPLSVLSSTGRSCCWSDMLASDAPVRMFLSLALVLQATASHRNCIPQIIAQTGFIGILIGFENRSEGVL